MIAGLPRFGLLGFARRMPPPADEWGIAVAGLVSETVTFGQEELAKVPRRELTADFHCVATWTVKGCAGAAYGSRTSTTRWCARAADRSRAPRSPS